MTDNNLGVELKSTQSDDVIRDRLISRLLKDPAVGT
jgi:hypothetical protein